MCLDPRTCIVNHLQPFVERSVNTMPAYGEMISRIRPEPFKVEQVKRIVTIHAREAVHLSGIPTFGIAGQESRSIPRGTGTAGLNISHGFIIAALIVFAATVSDARAFERWLKNVYL